MRDNQLKNIVFDLGGVLIDWNPRYLFAEVFQNEDELDYFLSQICTSEWNEEQDAGRSLAEGTQILVEKHPNFQREIQMYYDQWVKMLGGPIFDHVRVFEELILQEKYQIYALTNWSAETFPIAKQRYAFLDQFKDILVSGVEGVRKPQRAFYQLMLDRFQINPRETLFIDDNLRNIKEAEAMKIHCIHLDSGTSLKAALEAYHVFTHPSEDA